MKRRSTSLGIKKCKSKLQWDTTLHLLKWLLLTRQIITSVEKLWRKSNPYSLLLRTKNGIATLENSIVVTQNIKNRVTIWPSNSFSGYPSEKLKNVYSQRYVHPCVHCSLIHGGQDIETTEDWIEKLWYTYTMKYYSAIRKDEILPFVSTWMGLENIMPSENSRSIKAKNHMISLKCGI